jgi:hypothetical protein
MLTGSSLLGTTSTASLALAAALGGLGGLAGCGTADHGRDERRMIDALTRARDTVCACRDLDCAEDAERRLADFLLLHVDSLKKIPAPSRSARNPSGDPIANQAARIDGELRACKHRLEAAARPS